MQFTSSRNTVIDLNLGEAVSLLIYLIRSGITVGWTYLWLHLLITWLVQSAALRRHLSCSEQAIAFKDHVKAFQKVPPRHAKLCLTTGLSMCVVRSRTGGLQSVHLSPTARIRRRGTGADVYAVRERHQLQGVHRSCHQSEQMLRYSLRNHSRK